MLKQTSFFIAIVLGLILAQCVELYVFIHVHKYAYS